MMIVQRLLLVVAVVLPSIFASSFATNVPPKTPVTSGFGPVPIGARHELTCDGSQPDSGRVNYAWFKSFFNGVDDWKTKGPISESQTLVIDSVSESHVFHPGQPAESYGGWYMCRVSNEAGTRDSEWKELFPFTPCHPGISYVTAVSPQSVPVGSSFTVDGIISNPTGLPVSVTKQINISSLAKEVAFANASACTTFPALRFTWIHCSPTSNDSTIFKLRVLDAKLSDYAYWVITDSGHGCSSPPVKPVIQVSPGQTNITGFPMTVVDGDVVSLQCDSTHPSDGYDWYRNGTYISTSRTLDFIAKKDRAADYSCLARNGVGSESSSNMTLIVYYKPDNVEVFSEKGTSPVGETDIFECSSIGGNPHFQLTIYFKPSRSDVAEVVVQGQKRYMRKEDNQGEYYCVADVPSNPRLKMNSDIKTYSVTFPNTKVFLNASSDARDGEVTVYRCQTDEHNPAAKSIRWSKLIILAWMDITEGITLLRMKGPNGGVILISELRILAKKALNGQLLKCTSHYSHAGHEYNTSSHTFINVNFNPPKITMVTMPQKPVYEGERVEYICETDIANPAASIGFYNKIDGGHWTQIRDGISSEFKNGILYQGKVTIGRLIMTAYRGDDQIQVMCRVEQGDFQINASSQMTVFFPGKAQLIQGGFPPVTEGDDLTLICAAFGGNPKNFVYEWQLNAMKILNEISRELRIISINYIQGGIYECHAINYSPGGIANASLLVDVQSVPKWNHLYPNTTLCQLGQPVNISIHVVCSPPASNVTWHHPNNQTAIDTEFTETRVDESTFILSKTSVNKSDFGTYTVVVKNPVGKSHIEFKVIREGPPNTPLKLRVVNSTAVSVTLAFDPNPDGGRKQKFTIEIQSPVGGAWKIVAGNFSFWVQSVVWKVASLSGNTTYNFRVAAANEHGSSEYSEIIHFRTKAIPSINATIIKTNGTYEISWQALQQVYAKIQIKYCRMEENTSGPAYACKTHLVRDQASGTTSIGVDEGTPTFYFQVYDGDDLVYSKGIPAAISALPTSPEGKEGSETSIPVWQILFGVVLFVLLVMVGVSSAACIKLRRVRHGNDGQGRGERQGRGQGRGERQGRVQGQERDQQPDPQGQGRGGRQGRVQGQERDQQPDPQGQGRGGRQGRVQGQERDQQPDPQVPLQQPDQQPDDQGQGRERGQGRGPEQQRDQQPNDQEAGSSQPQDLDNHLHNESEDSSGGTIESLHSSQFDGHTDHPRENERNYQNTQK